MQPSRIPAWCRWHGGDSSILVVAPHGGRRRTVPVPLRPRKVNDLHTADLAFYLAEKLDASFLVNETVDRNELDLNRISQVARRARWFLDAIEQRLARILDRHATALLVFVHGWNVTQARCDVGIGASIANEDTPIQGNEKTTISEAFLRERLRRFRHLCEAAGIRTTYGERYPASHPNNVLQIFRRAVISPEAETSGRISEWVAAQRVEAVQLELGVAVRWPGATRTAFVAAMAEAFAGAPPSFLLAESARSRQGTPLRPPASLQCFDPVSGIGVSAGLSVESGPVLRGRLLLFLGGQRVALFVGEDRRRDRLVSGGPEFHIREGGFRLSFEGGILCADDGGLYLDLEDAFAASTLRQAQLELCFDALNEGRYGKVQGTVRLDDRAWTFDCYGFADGFVRPSTSLRPSHTALSACFGAELALQARTGDRHGSACGTITRITSGEKRNDDLHVLSIELDPDGYSPRRITVPLGSGKEIVAEPLNRMSIYRPGAGRRAVRVTFGIARVRLDDRNGFGFYEYARPLRTTSAT